MNVLKNMKYINEINQAMRMLGEMEKTVFLGQSVKWKGTGLFWTLEGVPPEKRIELPVFEDIQMGISIGMALNGYLPVSIYPRMDFFILAYNQLFNHLDLMEEMSNGQFKPKVIIRTAIGSVKPLFPGPQHNKDQSKLLKENLKNVDVIVLEKPDEIIKEYLKAIDSNKSTILIEIPDKYQEEES